MVVAVKVVVVRSAAAREVGVSTVATRGVVAVMGEVARAVETGGARRAVAREAAKEEAAREVRMAAWVVCRVAGRPVAGRAVAAVVRAAEVRVAGWVAAAKAAETVPAG